MRLRGTCIEQEALSRSCLPQAMAALAKHEHLHSYAMEVAALTKVPWFWRRTLIATPSRTSGKTDSKQVSTGR